MLISRRELEFDFGGASFDVSRPQEREFLGWVFNQFLYGEITGIQCGYWLYRAPHLRGASFLARQAGEELSHVKRILKILDVLEVPAGPPHPALRFLATGMMGNHWGEHVAMEMALGEGLVLTVFYALTATIHEPRIHRILESALEDEERHVEFGERETKLWLEEHPGDRDYLFALAYLQVLGLRSLKRYVLRRLRGRGGENFAASHPVLSRFDAFYDHLITQYERRLVLLGVADRPIAETGLGRKVAALLKLPFHRLRNRLRRPKLLTDTYLQDAWVVEFRKPMSSEDELPEPREFPRG